MRIKTLHYLCRNCMTLNSLQETEKQICTNCGKKLGKRDIRPTTSHFKNKILWPLFSEYVRKRDCISTTGNIDNGVCYTCERTYPYDKLQAGHLVTGRKDNILFDEENIKIQCYSCNVVKNGQQGLFLINRIEELRRQGKSLEESYQYILDAFNKKEIKYSLDDLINLYKYYQDKLKEFDNIDRNAN